uniref:Uncharacterized protein n=1 Tax=Zea mays TaxID=4577 RepID=C0PJ62_MAIZE|nr:unknown [Zea mays]
MLVATGADAWLQAFGGPTLLPRVKVLASHEEDARKENDMVEEILIPKQTIGGNWFVPFRAP